MALVFEIRGLKAGITGERKKMGHRMYEEMDKGDLATCEVV